MGVEMLARVPGKLFWFGEYAVLEGAAALVAAVDRVMTVRRDVGARGYRTLGMGSGPAVEELPAFVLGELGFGEWLPTLEIDARAFYHGGQKLGLGSSAATVVALVRACRPAADRLEVFEEAERIHRAFQGGRGSGADVACSAFGEMIAYVMGQRPRALRWAGESELRVEAVWLGVPARSVSFVKALEQARAREPGGVARALEELGELSGEAIARLESGEALALVGLAERADVVLGELGELMGQPVRTAVHEALAQSARGLGLAAKPSGAGGGDFSLVFGERGANWDALWAGLPQGCQRLELGWVTG